MAELGRVFSRALGLGWKVLKGGKSSPGLGWLVAAAGDLSEKHLGCKSLFAPEGVEKLVKAATFLCP